MSHASKAFLWAVKKDGDTIRAVMVTLANGFELRLTSGHLQVINLLCRTLSDVQFAAAREHARLVERGWMPIDRRDELTRQDHILPGDTVNEIEGNESKQ